MTLTCNQGLVKGLRELADFLEARPEIEMWGGLTINLFADTNEKFAEAARTMGSCNKLTDGAYFMLRKEFSGGIKVDVNRNREAICTKVKIGEKIIPAVPETVLPAKPAHVEEVYEWQCPESILNAVDPDDDDEEDDIDTPIVSEPAAVAALTDGERAYVQGTIDNLKKIGL